MRIREVEIETKVEATDELRVAPVMFLERVGASLNTVIVDTDDAETIEHWRACYAAGAQPQGITITFDGQGNVLGCDGRHRAAAAQLAGIPRIPVLVFRS